MTSKPLSIFEDLALPRGLFTPSFGQLGADVQPPPISIGTHPCAPFSQWRISPSSAGSTGVHNRDGFQVSLDVQQFKQEEVVVKTVGHFLVIEAKHEEKPTENRQITRQMTRKYELPDDVDLERIECSLSAEGMLLVKVPKIVYQPVPETDVKLIQITVAEKLQTEEKGASESIGAHKEE